MVNAVLKIENVSEAHFQTYYLTASNQIGALTHEVVLSEREYFIIKIITIPMFYCIKYKIRIYLNTMMISYNSFNNEMY